MALATHVAEDEDIVLDCIDHWMKQHAGDEHPVVYCDDRSGYSPASTAQTPRRRIELLVRSDDPAVAARCSASLWEATLGNDGNPIFIGFKYTNQMMAGELLMEVKHLNFFLDGRLLRLIDSAIPTARNKVIITTRRSQEEWAEVVKQHNEEAFSHDWGRIFRMVDARGGSWVESADDREGLRIDRSDWPATRVMAICSHNLPNLETEVLQHWLQPAFGSVLNPHAEESRMFALSKRINKGSWNKRNFWLDFQTEGAAKEATSLHEEFFQPDWSQGGFTWKLKSIHFTAKSVEEAEAASSSLGIDQDYGCTDFQSVFCSALPVAAARAASYFELCANMQASDVDYPPVSKLDVVQGQELSPAPKQHKRGYALLASPSQLSMGSPPTGDPGSTY